MATRLADALVISAAALLWGAFAVKAVDAHRHPDKPTLRMLAAMLGALAITASLLARRQHLAQRVTASPTSPTRRTHLPRPRRLACPGIPSSPTQPSAAEAARRSRRRLWPAIARSALWVLFLAARRQTTERMTAAYGDLPFVQAYLLVFLLYLGVAVVDLMRGALRYAPAARASCAWGFGVSASVRRSDWHTSR